MTNTEELNRLIDESGYKRKYLAERLGLTPYGMAKKINNLSEFTSSEIAGLCELLGITSLKEKERIFFAC